MLQQKTILFTLDQLEYNGVSTHVQHCIEAAHDLGFRVLLLAFNSRQTDLLFNKKTELFLLHKTEGQSFFAKIKNFYVYCFHFFKIYTQECPSIVHFNHYQPLLLFSKLIRVKKIITFHGDNRLEHLSRSQNQTNFIFRFKMNLLAYFQGRALKTADQIIVLSNYSRRLLKKEFALDDKKIKKIVGSSLNKKKSPSKRSLKKLTPLKLLYFGRFEPRKGLSELLLMAKILEQQDLDFHLTIAGATMNDYFVKLFSEYQVLKLFTRVCFLPSFNKKQRVHLLNETDLVIMPSQNLETFGLTVLEASERGVSVIATPVGALPEIMKKLNPQFLANNKNPLALANKVLEFSQLSLKDRLNLSQQLLIKTEQYFSFTKFKQDLKKVYVSN